MSLFINHLSTYITNWIHRKSSKSWSNNPGRRSMKKFNTYSPQWHLNDCIDQDRLESLLVGCIGGCKIRRLKVLNLIEGCYLFNANVHCINPSITQNKLNVQIQQIRNTTNFACSSSIFILASVNPRISMAKKGYQE